MGNELSVKEDWRIPNPRLEEDLKKANRACTIETQTIFPTQDCRMCNPRRKEHFMKRSGKKHVGTQTASLKRVSFREEDLNKSRGKTTVETQTRFSLQGEHKLAQDLRDLFYSGEEADVVLRVRGRDFRSHRAMLAARSAVFAAMLKHDMKEKVSGVVQIEDCDPGVFECFLEYLYTGSNEFSEDSVVSLYEIADKYDSPDLKERCVDFMSSTMSVETFCEMAKLSLKYNESKLFQRAIDFFKKNVRKISLSVEWQTFLKEHPLQANEFNIKALEYHGIRE